MDTLGRVVAAESRSHSQHEHSTAQLAELAPGDPHRVGRFRIRARIGVGGMGVVFVAQDRRRLVAVKVLRSELADVSGFRERFRREIVAAASMHARCTVRFVTADPDAERPYFVTEYVKGPTLERYVSERGPLRGDALRAFAAGIADGLDAIGRAGFVHRDLKPTNVLLTTTGPKIIDFGIARGVDTIALTESGQRVGTPRWMAPEQVLGEPITPATDVFAWGAVVAYAGRGMPVFGIGDSDAVLYRVIHAAPDLSGLDSSIAPLVERALSKEPEQRPPVDVILAELFDDRSARYNSLESLLAHAWPDDIPLDRAALPRPRRHRTTYRRRRLLSKVTLAAAAAVALFAGATLVIAADPGRTPAGTTLLRFHTGVYPDFTSDRQWALAGATADRLTGTLTVRNTTDEPLPTGSHIDEVIPKSVTQRANHVRSEPRSQVIQEDPVIRFDLSGLASHQVRTIRYSIPVKATGQSPRVRLNEWSRAQIQATLKYCSTKQRACPRSIARITITLAPPSLSPGQTWPLRLTGLFDDGTQADQTELRGAKWRSSNPSALGVDARGVIAALSPGAATITATIGSTSDEVKVVVNAPDTTSRLTPATTTTTQTRASIGTTTTTLGTTATTISRAPGVPRNVHALDNPGDASWIYDKIVWYDPPSTGDPPTDFKICLKIPRGFDTCGLVAGQGSDYTYQPIVAIDGIGNIVPGGSGNVAFDSGYVGTDLRGMSISVQATNAFGTSPAVTIPG